MRGRPSVTRIVTDETELHSVLSLLQIGVRRALPKLFISSISTIPFVFLTSGT